MDPVVTVVVSAAASIAVGLVGAFVARRKGLPGINAEVELRMAALVDTLQGQVTALGLDFTACKTRLSASEAELRATRREMRSTEFELLELYRSTGTKPPRRLEDRAHDA